MISVECDFDSISLPFYFIIPISFPLFPFTFNNSLRYISLFQFFLTNSFLPLLSFSFNSRCGFYVFICKYQYKNFVFLHFVSKPCELYFENAQTVYHHL